MRQTASPTSVLPYYDGAHDSTPGSCFVAVGCVDVQKGVIKDWNVLFKNWEMSIFKRVLLGTIWRTCMRPQSCFL